jgi:glutamate/tyrosine decarboxylase-like PLP-dependent enzyme
MANLEALWVAGQLHPGKKIVASHQSHYTHERISGVLQLPFEKVASDARGRMDLNALEKLVERGDVGTVVATMGTTATGSVDPLPEILKLREKCGFRVHVDGAYGGYFVLVSNLEEKTAEKFSRVTEVDSIVIDPHKHGLQPYGCGCVLFRDPALGRLYKARLAIYVLQFQGIASGRNQHGVFAARRRQRRCGLRKIVAAGARWRIRERLERGRKRRCNFRAIESSGKFDAAFEPELAILAFVPKGDSIEEISAKSRGIFETAARKGLHLAVAELPVKFWSSLKPQSGRATVTCLRSVLMKPEHLEWVGRIVELLKNAAAR